MTTRPSAGAARARPASTTALLLAALAVAGTAARARTEAPAPAALPVRVQERPEIPWLVVVVALDAPASPAKLADPVRPTVQALFDAGGAVDVEERPDGALVVVEGPPAAEGLVVAAARASAADAKAARAALFVEGRTTLVDAGALPPSRGDRAPGGGAAAAGAGAPPGAGALPLAPSPALFDVEGEALVAFVERAVPHARASLALSRGSAVLVVDGGPGFDRAAARAALAAAVAAPLPRGAVDDLRARAEGRLAARRSRVGAWAHDTAALWLAFDTVDVEDVDDLGVRVRARLFPSVLFGP